MHNVDSTHKIYKHCQTYLQDAGEYEKNCKTVQTIIQGVPKKYRHQAESFVHTNLLNPQSNLKY